MLAGCSLNYTGINFVHDVLGTLFELLRPQAVWWRQPRELVADLFRKADGF